MGLPGSCGFTRDFWQGGSPDLSSPNRQLVSGASGGCLVVTPPPALWGLNRQVALTKALLLYFEYPGSTAIVFWYHLHPHAPGISQRVLPAWGWTVFLKSRFSTLVLLRLDVRMSFGICSSRSGYVPFDFCLFKASCIQLPPAIR